MPTRGRPSRNELSERLASEIGELWERMGGLPDPREAREIWKGVWYEEAHHSTAIEGNTLVLKQVETLLREGRAVGGKELREYMEVRGYAAAADWVYQQAREGEWADGDAIAVTELRHIHRLAMEPAWEVAPHPDAGPEETPGNFRRHDIHPFPGGMAPPPWPEVSARISDWIATSNAIAARSESFADDLARAHCMFERIHPFIDGNGRAGRLALNLILVRLGYPPIIIYKNQKSAYLRALRRADEEDFGALAELLTRAILASLYRFVAGPESLVPLAALANHDLGADALRVAAIRGRLQAIKGPDGLWRSTYQWVDDYREQRRRYRRRAQTRSDGEPLAG